ncbi:MAG: hypothetical protein ACK4Y7_00245 [Caldimicrobium sp.]
MRKFFFTFLLSIFLLIPGNVFAQENRWSGMDEAVIEKIAKDKGKEPKPFLELEGDLELFAFSLFFGISGFIAGYYWRKLFSERKSASSPL